MLKHDASKRLCCVLCIVTDVLCDMLMTCWVNVSCCWSSVFLCWITCYDVNELSVCPISVAIRTSGLVRPECGECYSAVAVLVSREIWPSYDELVW